MLASFPINYNFASLELLFLRGFFSSFLASVPILQSSHCYRYYCEKYKVVTTFGEKRARGQNGWTNIVGEGEAVTRASSEEKILYDSIGFALLRLISKAVEG